LEEGYQVMSKEENSRLAARQEKFIQNLRTPWFGLKTRLTDLPCTGKLISKERLRSVPHATLSIEAKLNQK